MDLEVARKLADDCVSDGVKLGFRAAIDALAGAKNDVAAENQTWEAALAFLRVVELDYVSDFKINR